MTLIYNTGREMDADRDEMKLARSKTDWLPSLNVK